MSGDRCPACGAPAPGGRAACQAIWDEMRAHSLGDIAYTPSLDLAFDAYCMQHPEEYCRSAKSYAAHLTRLCCGLEYGGDPRVYAAIQRWLNGLVLLDKPELLSERGCLTVADLRAAGSAAGYAGLVRDWARSVWAAYTPQHEIARAWIKAAVASAR